MDELKQRLITLVQSLMISDQTKQELLKEIEAKGLAGEVLERVQAALDNSIADFQQATARQMEELEQKLETNEREIVKEFKALQTELKNQQIETARHQDQQQLDEIRKKLSD